MCPYPSVGWEARERLGHSPSWVQRGRVPPSPLPLVADGSDISPYHPYFIYSRVFLVCPTLSEEALSRKQALPWAYLARETKHSPSARCVPLSAAHFHLLFSSPAASARFICSRAGAAGREAFATGLRSTSGHPKPLCFTQNLHCPLINHTEAQGDVAGRFWLSVMSNQQSSHGTSSPPSRYPGASSIPAPATKHRHSALQVFIHPTLFSKTQHSEPGREGGKEREQRSDAHVLRSRPGPEHQEGQEPAAPAHVTALSGWEGRDKRSVPLPPPAHSRR